MIKKIKKVESESFDPNNIFLLPENQALYINHPDYRFVDVSGGVGEDIAHISLYDSKAPDDSDSFVDIFIELDFKGFPSMLHSHPDKGTTLIKFIDHDKIVNELECLMEKSNG